MVRRLGYGAADTRLTFASHETVERRVVLGAAVTLDPVFVAARANDRYMPDFEDNRRLGLGHFMTRANLEKYSGMRLTSVLQQMPGFGVVAGRASSWVFNSRMPPPPCVGNPPDARCLTSYGYYVPDKAEQAQGMATACYVHVYIDGMLMNGGKDPAEPYDFNALAPESVEAVEYYNSPAQTPLKYSRMGSTCGVLVLWLRRKS